jgi:hypothetical protein
MVVSLRLPVGFGDAVQIAVPVQQDPVSGIDDVYLEGEASRFRWLRAPATTEIE